MTQREIDTWYLIAITGLIVLVTIPALIALATNN